MLKTGLGRPAIDAQARYFPHPIFPPSKEFFVRRLRQLGCGDRSRILQKRLVRVSGVSEL